MDVGLPSSELMAHSKEKGVQGFFACSFSFYLWNALPGWVHPGLDRLEAIKVTSVTGSFSCGHEVRPLPQ